MADVIIEEMPEDVVLASRQLTSPLHEKLQAIQADESYHGRLLRLDTFELPLQKGKAYQQKQNMTSYYGHGPEVLGFSFVVTRATDGKHEYLGVTFDPSKIVEGAWEEFQDEKAAKAEKAAARKAEREAEAKMKADAKAEIEALEGAE